MQAAVLSLLVTGEDYEDDEDEFRPVPHPDDRLWRHPSEIAAAHAAAHAKAETAQLAAVEIVEPERSRIQLGLMIAAGVVTVGAAALTVGILTGPRTASDTQLASSVANIVPTSTGLSGSAGDTATNNNSAFDSVSAGAGSQGEGRLSARIYDEVAASLPLIQVATADGTRDGSGFFVTDNGHIATSAGLIEGADYVLAWTNDGQRWHADVIAVDPISDIAVLRIDSDFWSAVALGSDDMLRIGQYALALDHETQQVGIGDVTAIYGPAVGVDQPAAVPGSALIDDTGAVIAMLTSDGTRQHATPAWMIEKVVIDLIATGSTTHSWLGVVVESMDSTDVASPAVRVREVVTGSPADRAGLMTNDLIHSINGTAVSDPADLYRQVHESGSSTEVVLTVTRNDDRRLVIATLAALPE